jgi:putative membrane protein
MNSSESIAKKLHPLSLVFELANRVRTNLIPAIFASFSVLSGGVIGLYFGCAVFGIAITYSIIRFLTFRYRLTDRELLVDQGLLFHNHKVIPLERIQNIDSVQNLFHRLVGVAEVRVETASGTEPEATMRVLGVSELESLKAGIRNRTIPVVPSTEMENDRTNESLTGTQHATNEESTLLTLSTWQLIQAGFLSNRGQVLLGLAFGYLIQGQFSGFYPSWPISFQGKTANQEDVGKTIRTVTTDLGTTIHSAQSIQERWGVVGIVLAAVLLVLVVLLLLRLVSMAWFLWRFSGYRLTIRDGSLYVRCGLFTKISATVPRDRIQLISIQRSWLFRYFGLASIRLETSGGSGEQVDDASKSVGRKWFIPVMPESELPKILKALHPELDWDPQSLAWQSLSSRAFQRTSRIPIVVGVTTLLVGSLFLALAQKQAGILILVGGLVVGSALMLLEWKQAKSRKYARSALCVVYRSGIIMQQTCIGFLDRIQSIDLVQSPFDRRWQMASLHFDTAGSSSSDHQLRVALLDHEVARKEFETLTMQVS